MTRWLLLNDPLVIGNGVFIADSVLPKKACLVVCCRSRIFGMLTRHFEQAPFSIC
jgi:hypothetical protein